VGFGEGGEENSLVTWKRVCKLKEEG